MILINRTIFYYWLIKQQFQKYYYINGTVETPFINASPFFSVKN